MNDWGASVLLMILGAFLGSIISPASELFFANFFSKKGKSYSFGNGLTLLCAANAAWVISFILFESSKTNGSALFVTILLYIFAAILLISSFSQFKKSEFTKETDSVKQILLCLVMGNLMWLIAESSEVILRIFGLDSFPSLIIKYILFFASFLSFSSGMRVGLKIKKSTA